MLHYCFPIALGIFIGSKMYNEPLAIIPGTILTVAVFFSFQASIVLNDINDIRADRIVKRCTPLGLDGMTQTFYRRSGIVFFAVSLLVGAALGYRMLLIVLLGNVLHFLYSSPPFRIKRYYPLSVLFLALGAWLTAVAGFALYEPAKPFITFPAKASLFIVVPLFLALNFRDLADYEGDRATGVYTLFTLLGPERARLANAVLLFLSYQSVPMILGYYPLLSVTFPLGLLSSFAALRRPFREYPIFIIYFAFVVVLTIWFNLNPSIVLS